LNPVIAHPTSRLLAFLELLHARRAVDGPTAAAELGVSERTIRRYAVALQDIGILVEGQSGVGGGYRLGAGTRLPPLMLSDEEAAATVYGLMLAAQRNLSGADGALAKIARVLPEPLTRRIERLQDELVLSGEPQPPAASSETLAIHYTRRDGTSGARQVDPLGLVARQGRWYMPARDRASMELRTFRADRISTAALAGPAEPAEPGFDPDVYVLGMLARLPWAWEIEVLLDATIDAVSPRISPTIAELSAEGNGTQLIMRVDSLEWAAGVLAGLGAKFAIRRPDELREHVAALARRLDMSAERGCAST